MGGFPRRNPPRLCSIEGCGQIHNAKGLCRRHYLRSLYLKSRVLTGRKKAPLIICQVENCGLPQHARKLCPRHYALWRWHNIRKFKKAKQREIDSAAITTQEGSPSGNASGSDQGDVARAILHQDDGRSRASNT